jgi:hypothetical protein
MRRDRKLDFRAEHEAWLDDQPGGEVPNEGNFVAWEDVLHFVLLPNYKEDIDILREAIDSCAGSSLARDQMGLVLAMEAREPDVVRKADELIAEYRSKFKYVIATYHPPGLPNEMPGKASNTRWAAQRLWAFMEQKEIDTDTVVLTISDADSEFQEKCVGNEH